MPRIVVPIPWTEQPQYPTGIKRDEPLSEGLVDAFNPLSITNRTDLRGYTPTVSVGPITSGVGQLGRNIILPASVADCGIVLANNGDDLFPSATDATIFVIRRSRDTVARNSGLFGYHTSATDRVLCHAPYSDGNMYFDFGGTDVSQRISAAYTKSTSIDFLVFVAGGGKGREIWRNRVKIAGDVTKTGARTTTSSAFRLGAYPGGESDNEEIYLFGVANRAWSDAEIIRWFDNPSRIYEDEEFPVWFSVSTGPTLIELTTASFTWAKNPIQNRATATMSAPTLRLIGQNIQNRSTITTTIASLKFTAQSIQNKATVALTTASLKFVAQAISVANGAAATVIDLTTAAFNYSAKALQFSQKVTLSAAALAFSPKAIQNRASVTMTSATLSFLAKALQNKLTIALSVASFSFIAWAINVTGAVASVVARLLTLLGVGS